MLPQFVTRHLTIRGRVQGVGFRAAMGAEADRLGIVGWVRDRADGSVEAVVQGPPDAVAALVTWARHGPPAARVTAVDVAEASARPFTAFERKPSA